MALDAVDGQPQAAAASSPETGAPNQDATSPASSLSAFLNGYKFFPIPNLSAVRVPLESTDTTSVRVRHPFTDRHLFLALARILGAYSSNNDVLLCTRASYDGSVKAVRVSWESASSWQAVLDNIAVGEFQNDEIAQALGLNVNQNPYVAVVSDDLSFDHPLVVQQSDDQSVTFKTSTVFFHNTAADVLANQVAAIIEDVVEQPQSNPADLSFLPHSLQSRDDRCAHPPSYTHIKPAESVVEYVIRYSIATPDKIAVEWFPDLESVDLNDVKPAEYITYAELHRRSNQFARYLVEQGVQREDRVAICGNRDVNFHIVMFGILKAGGCYVPIDPELATERQQFIISDSKAKLVITSDNIPTHIDAANKYDDAEINLARPLELSYLLYTSGTTGTPKGCLLTHEGLAQAIYSLSWYTYEARGPPMRYLAVASVAFDVHLAETFVPLSVAMTLVSAPRSQLLEDLPHWLRYLRVTHVGIVPSLIEATLCALEGNDGEGALDSESCPSTLRYIASGGEKMSDSILERWANHPRVKLANFYGPSEVTIGCAARFMYRNTRKENVGRVFDNCSAYVIDEKMNVVAKGALGELLVAGPLVGRGYLGRDDLTEKVFLQWEGRKAYRTGDLVRMMPDGTLEILGRIDTQIKLRGVRIESEGISAVLRRAGNDFPGLKTPLDASTVLAKHPVLQTDQLVSFIAWDTSVSVTQRRTQKPHILTSAPRGLFRALRNACARELASYMRPAHIVPMSFLPMNSNGKTDNKVLISIFQSESLDTIGKAAANDLVHRPQGHGADAANLPKRPLTDLEEKLVDFIVPLSKIEKTKFTPYSNLFELGFDSLKLVRLASQVRKHFELNPRDVSLGELIHTPTVEGIAKIVERLVGGRDGNVPNGDAHGDTNGDTSQSTPSSGPSYVTTFAEEYTPEVHEALGAEIVESVLPTFPLQDGVLARSMSDPLLYVEHGLLKVKEGGEDVVGRVREAWEETVRRYEILRTVFLFTRSIVQVVLKADAVKLQWEDRVLDPKEVGNDIANWFMHTEASKLSENINLNIGTTPPLRIIHYTLDNTHYIGLAIHHAVYDAVTLPQILREVELAYAKSPTKPTAPLSQVLELIHATDQEQAATFWRGIFEGYDWKKAVNRFTPGQEAIFLDIPFKATLAELEAEAAGASVTLQALLTCAYAAALAKNVYRYEDVTFGVIRSGRSFASEEINDSLCPLLTVTPARVNLALREDLLQRTQNDIGSMLPYEHVPLSKVQHWVQPSKNLFDTLFSVIYKDEYKGTVWDIVKSTQPQADYVFALEVIIDQEAGTILGHSAYAESDISPELVRRIINDVEAMAIALAREDFYELESIKASSKTSANGTAVEDSDEEEDDNEEIEAEFLEKIMKLVAKFLKIDRKILTPTSSLISFGLDSIKSVGLSRVLKKVGVNVPPMEVIRRPTVRSICLYESRELRGTLRKEDKEAANLIQYARESLLPHVNQVQILLSDTDKLEIYPTTTLQSGMLSQTIHSMGRLYVHEFPFILAPTIDKERLKLAWEKAIQSTSILRTSFHFLQDLGCWAQIVHSDTDLKWDEVAVSPDQSITTLIKEFVDSIDLSTENSFARPPVFLRLFKREEKSESQNDVLLLVLHHALYDGIAIDKLSNVVLSHYLGDQPPATPQFTDFLGYFEYQSRHGTQYWVNYLQEYRPPRLPRALTGVDSAASHVASMNIPIGADTLRHACQQFNATVQCFGQAVWAHLLAKLCSTNDIVFGHVVSGRSVRNAEDVVGPMITTIPCRVRFSECRTNMELVRAVQHSNAASLKWQHASLRAIQKAVGVGSLWDSIFLFQPPQDTSGPTKRFWEFMDAESEIAKVQYALNIELHQFDDRLEVHIAAQGDVMAEENLQELARSFASLFVSLIERPEENTLVPEELHAPDEQVTQVNGHANHAQYFELPEGLSKANVAQLREILSKATKVREDDIHYETTLLSMGIDSISAIQITAKLRQAGIRLYAADVLRCNTFYDLLLVMHQKSINKHDPLAGLVNPITEDEKAKLLAKLNVTPDMIEDVNPITPGLKWCVAMWQLSGRSLFQYAFTMKVKTPASDGTVFTEERLRNAWETLVRARPIFRSTFVSLDRKNVRMVTFKEMPAERMWKVIRVYGDNSNDQLLAAQMRKVASNPLSTELPPSQAIMLYINDVPYFILHLHHFHYDAWCYQLHTTDLSELYHGRPPYNRGELLPWVLQVQPTPEREAEQKAYWTSVFPPNFKPPRFPTLNPGGGPDRSIVTDFSILKDLQLLQRTAKEKRLSLNSVFLACWARVQALFAGTDDATFALWSLNRTGDSKHNLETLAVPAVNVYPVYTRTDTTNTEVMNTLHSQLRRRTAVIEQTYLESIHEWLGVKNEPLVEAYVNVVLGAGQEEIRGDTFPMVDVPYFIPTVENEETNPTIPRLEFTDILSDAIMVEIIAIEKQNSVLMSVETAGHLMSEYQIREMIDRWAVEVQKTLGLL